MLKRLRRDDKGVTIVEFSMILPALCVLLLGIFDLGYRSYAGSVVQGALHEAARMATVGNVSLSTIDARVRQRLSNFATNSTVTTSVRSYYDFAGVDMPEKITSDTAPTGQYNVGDCYEDANGNSQYDTDRGRSGSMGGADDIVRYQVSMSFPRIVPLAGLLGWSNSETITANTVLRTQPYAGRSVSTVVRCS
ncbi:MAG: TadE/TadG family type IV pilus assembly protein [Sphingosinicella sp.]